MARRRLQAILATTVITVGITAAPAMAQELPGLTDTVDDTLTQVTEEVSTATSDVVDTLVPTEDATTEDATAEPSEEPSEDDTLLDVGTGDGTLDVDLDVDVAPSDEDGSPQLEIDGGITVADQEVDLGDATEPIEQAIDPDPAEPTSTETSSETSTEEEAATDGTSHRGGPDGFLAGGGVVAAGDGARPVFTTGTTTTRSGSASGSRSYGAWDGGSFGVQRYGGGTMHMNRVPDPEVAPPAAAPQGADEFAEFPEAPEVAGESTPAVLATGMPDSGTDSPLVAALRALAGALVLATGAAWTRRTRDA